MAKFAAGTSTILTRWVRVHRARACRTSRLLAVTLLSGWAQFAAQSIAVGATVDFGYSSEPQATRPVITAFAGSTAGGSRTATLSLHGGGSSCRFDTVRFAAPTADTPTGVAFPDGLIDFVAADCLPGSTLTFTLVFSGPLPADAKYWRYGRTSHERSLHWYPAPALISGDTVTYRITDGDVGDDDLVANGIITGAGGLGIGAASAPPAPDGLTATIGNDNVSLRWNAVISATGYTIKRAVTKAGPYIRVSINQASNVFADKDGANGSTYFYVVSSINSAGESADSAQAQATPLPSGQLAACGAQPVTVPRTTSCPPEMAGAFVEEEVYVCSGTQWRSTGWRVTKSTCTPMNFGSAPPATL